VAPSGARTIIYEHELLVRIEVKVNRPLLF
jgi:hypothetical protein